MPAVGSCQSLLLCEAKELCATAFQLLVSRDVTTDCIKTFLLLQACNRCLQRLECNRHHRRRCQGSHGQLTETQVRSFTPSTPESHRLSWCTSCHLISSRNRSQVAKQTAHGTCPNVILYSLDVVLQSAMRGCMDHGK